MKDRITTLLLIIKNNKILLAQKKRGFSVGKYNGAGGKVENGETVEECMIRETREEINVTPVNYTKRAVITFNIIEKGERLNIIMHTCTADDYEGEIKESEEMRPEWFDLDKIPFDKMLPDDKVWYPVILAGKNFEAYFKFDENFNILEQQLTVL